MGVDVLMAAANVPGMTFTTNLSDLSSNIQKIITSNAQSQGITAAQYLTNMGGVDTTTGVYGSAAASNPTGYLTDAAYSAALANGTLLDKLNAAANPATPAKAAQATSTVDTAAAAAAAGQRQNAIAFLTSTFTDLGLGGDIANAITNLVQQGYTADTIQMIAQDPKSKDPLAVAFQQRFPANAARLAAGLPVLSPSEYLATERSYAQVMSSYGLNNNFATNKDIFTKLLTNDISPSELNSRASTAKAVIENTDPGITAQLQNYYGLSQGDMIAHVLDPSIASPIIEKQIASSTIGAEAARYGTNVNQSYAEQLAGIGVTQSQAAQGFGNIASQQPGMQSLASRYQGYTQAGDVGGALQSATFGTGNSALSEQELNRLKTQEVSQFSGSSGAGKGSLYGTEAGTN